MSLIIPLFNCRSSNGQHLLHEEKLVSSTATTRKLPQLDTKPTKLDPESSNRRPVQEEVVGSRRLFLRSSQLDIKPSDRHVLHGQVTNRRHSLCGASDEDIDEFAITNDGPTINKYGKLFLIFFFEQYYTIFYDIFIFARLNIVFGTYL